MKKLWPTNSKSPVLVSDEDYPYLKRNPVHIRDKYGVRGVYDTRTKTLLVRCIYPNIPARMHIIYRNGDRTDLRRCNITWRKKPPKKTNLKNMQTLPKKTNHPKLRGIWEPKSLYSIEESKTLEAYQWKTMPTCSIGQLARLTGIRQSVLRTWADRALLRANKIGFRKRRVFITDRALADIHRITELKKEGKTLKEIHTILTHERNSA